ncbi:9411_t:CDS:2 [Racocetra fulgida]|uniref:9411_t:CDS:1 n=1 Tax=Racocetra fulgida TaxID=60492 RepID=A0A9N8V910_9GLOM|nr:9411_t:CDS:2 [Racocetra fulgida]
MLCNWCHKVIPAGEELKEQDRGYSYISLYEGTGGGEGSFIGGEINSLSELDEKIKLVNSKTGFPPFKEIPPIDKFNQETSQNVAYKGLTFFASDLNALLDNYLSKIFQGLVYAEAIHDELGKQLGITNHKNYKLQHTEIALNEFVFKGKGPEPGDDPEEDPNPHPSNNPVIKEFQQKAQEIKELLKPCEKLIKSIEEVKKTKEDLKSQLEEKRKRELNPDGTDNLTSIATKKQIAKVELEITKIENSGLFHEIETAKIYLANFARDIINFENESEFMKKDIVAR